MPNWCSNSLFVEGPEKDVAAFKRAAAGSIQSYNDIRAKGKEWPVHDDIRLRAAVEETPEPGEYSDLSFHALMPVPDKVRRFGYDSTQSKGLADALGVDAPMGGYEWEHANWGVKWGACEVAMDDSIPDKLIYDFDTAWAPPIEFFTRIAKKWTNLKFSLSYSEPGMAFEGEISIQGDEILSHEEREMENEYEDEEHE